MDMRMRDVSYDIDRHDQQRPSKLRCAYMYACMHAWIRIAGGRLFVDVCATRLQLRMPYACTYMLCRTGCKIAPAGAGVPGS